MVFVPFVNVPPSVAEKVTVFPSITAEASDCGLLALSTSSYSRLTPANVNVMVLVVLVISLGNNEAALRVRCDPI